MCPIQCVQSSCGSSVQLYAHSSFTELFMVVYLVVNTGIYIHILKSNSKKEKDMAQPNENYEILEDDKGKLEVAVRILGNELVALKMEVDDFKMKWLVYGVITIVALAWAGGTYGPPLINMMGS